MNTEIKECAPSVFHLIKTLAKQDIETVRRIIQENSSAGLDISGVNAKGQGGLHAALSVARWDIAKELLEVWKCDPMKKDKSGRNFFIQLVKTEGSPWEDVLSSRPDLIERHRKHLVAPKVERIKKNESSETKGEDMFRRREKNGRRKERECLDPQKQMEMGALVVSHPLTCANITLDQLYKEVIAKLATDPTSAQLFSKAGGHPGYCHDGRTIGIALASLGREAMSKVQMSGGWTWEAPNSEGERPLTWAIKNGSTDVVKFLANIGQNLNVTDAHGNTALHLFAKEGDADMIEYLLSYGANPKLQNDHGETPYDLARSSRNSEVLDVLGDARGFSQKKASAQRKPSKNGRGHNPKKGYVGPGNLDKPLKEVSDLSDFVTAPSLRNDDGKQKKGPIIIIKKSRAALLGGG